MITYCGIQAYMFLRPNSGVCESPSTPHNRKYKDINTFLGYFCAIIWGGKFQSVSYHFVAFVIPLTKM